MKKLNLIIMCILIIIFYTSCNTKKTTKELTVKKIIEEEVVNIQSNFEEAKDIKEAEKLAGFSIRFNKIEEYEEIIIEVIKDELIQIILENEENEIYIRKAKGENKNISGDYNEYSDTKVIEVEGTKINLRGEENLYNLAIWSKGKFSYSVDSSNALEEESILKIIKEIDKK